MPISFTDNTPRLRAINDGVQSVTDSSSGVVVVFPVIREAVGVNLVGGEVEFLVNGVYNIQVTLYCGNTGWIESWVESYDKTTSTWLPLADSAAFKEFNYPNEGIIQYILNGVTLSPGLKLRLKVRASSSTVQLKTRTLSNGLTVSSASVSLSRIGS
jgi:hypothetical protein